MMFSPVLTEFRNAIFAILLRSIVVLSPSCLHSLALPSCSLGSSVKVRDDASRFTLTQKLTAKLLFRVF